MAVDSFKSITQSFKGTGLKAVIDDITVTKYATSIKGLTLEQANLALSTTQLSATEKESVLVKAGLIAQTEALTATDAVYRLQQKLGNDLSAKDILISAGLVTQKEIEDGTTIKLTADKLKEALATGNLSLENYKLIASTFGVEGANYGEAVSFEVLGLSIKKAAAALWTFLTTNPVGWAILAGAAIAATVAIVDHFTVSLEESKEQLKDLKDECNGIETDLKSMNDELKTTADRMKELEGKETLTFTEKEEYDNLVKTNNELQRKIDLLKLEQETKNKEKNKTFVQTMEKDTENPFEYEVNPDGKKASGQYSISDEYLTNETGYIKAQFEIRKNLLDDLSKTETQEEKDRIQQRINEIDSFLQSKNKEWGEIAQDISYISNPTTDDEKAVNEWLDYINDFQDKMAIAMGGTNAKTNAFNRLVDNWQFDSIVQGLQDLGNQGKVTAEMLNNPKYNEFIQKLVEIGVIDSADNLDLIALAFNNFKEKVEPTTNAVKTAISSTQELLAKYDDAFSNQSKIQSAFDKIQKGTSLTADEVRELVALCPDLAGKFKELADGYSISGEELINANQEMTNGVIEDITKQRDELVKILNTPMSVNSTSDAQIAQDYFSEVKTQIESLDLILSMFGINVQNTEDKFGTVIDNTSNKIKAITTAMEEMADTGYITSSTYKDIAELGGNFTECLEYQNGKLVLNVDKLKDLEIQQLATAKSANSLAISELELKAASLAAHGQDFSDIQAQIESLMEENAVYTQLMEEIRNAKPDDKKTKDEEPESVKQFKKDLAEKEHLLNTNQISEQDYYEWLDDESKRVYGNLADYEEDLWKYDEQVYKWRQEQEEKLFDKKIENYKKLSDNAIDKYIDGNGTELTVNASFDYARSQINSAITETQNRINELSLKTGFEDDIEELKSDLEDLYDTLDDINKKEIEYQKDYIETLKNEYSDLMDEQIDQQKKLADEIEKSYESRISAIDKQIEAVKKVNEAEERQKSILEAQKKLREAKIKNRIILGNNGWEAREDKEAVKEAKEDLEKAYQDEQIAKLEEQKELLETQKDNSKNYYDKVVEDLESQKEAREKQYDILVDIYEQLGGEKRQTSLNDSLVAKLTSNGDINKAVQGLTPTEMKQAITSGLLTTDSNGNYAIDYSILDENSEAVKDNTDALNGVTYALNQFVPKTEETTDGTITVGGFNLVADENGNLTKRPVTINGKVVEGLGQKVKPVTKSEWEKDNKAFKNVGKFAGFDTMQSFLKAVMDGGYTIPSSFANQVMNNNVQSNIGKALTNNNDTITTIAGNNTPAFNCTVNIEGSADEKTVEKFKNVCENEINNYFQYLNNTMQSTLIKSRYSK